MMDEEVSYSIQDLQRKFQEWFGDSVPTDEPLPAEIEYSIVNPIPVEFDRSTYKLPGKHFTKLEKAVEMLIFGFKGALYLGSVIGFFLLMMNISFLGWYSDAWPNQIIIVFLITCFGFWGGAIRGSIYLISKDRFFTEKVLESPDMRSVSTHEGMTSTRL